MWVRSFVLFFTPVLVKAAGTSLLFSSVRARRSHWRTVRLCAACSLTCCAWFAGLASLRAQDLITAGISFSQLQALPGFALLIKLPSSISRTISVRRRRDRVESSCFLAVNTYQEERNVDHITASLECGAGESKSRVVNGLCEAST